MPTDPSVLLTDDAAALLPVAAALWLVAAPRPWRLLRSVITIVHEGGHVVTALLAGRRLSGVRVHADASGVTLSRGRPTGPGMIATLLAGYPAPCLVGLVTVALAASGRHLVALVVGVGLLSALLLAVRNLFGAAIVVGFGAALAAIGWYAPDAVQAAAISVVAWFLLLGGLRAVVELQRSRRRRRAPDSDADQLARLSVVPAVVWVATFAITAVASVAAAAAIVLRV